MMRLIILASCLTLSLPAGAHAQAAPAAHPEIFRYVTIVGDTIRLGVPWRNASHFARNATDTAITLPYGTFGGADGLVVYRSAAGSVTKVQFLYSTHRNFAAMLADYRTALGAPSDSSVKKLDDGVEGHWWRWRDQATTFDLVQFVPAHGNMQATAILADRASSAP
jgi:hypothetical protein